MASDSAAESGLEGKCFSLISGADGMREFVKRRILEMYCAELPLKLAEIAETPVRPGGSTASVPFVNAVR